MENMTTSSKHTLIAMETISLISEVVGIMATTLTPVANCMGCLYPSGGMGDLSIYESLVLVLSVGEAGEG